MVMEPRDLDALRRAMEWGKGFQLREPQLVVFPTPMPLEGSDEWIEVATRLAANAQAANLGLRPWEVEPCHANDVVHGGWGGKPDEVALRRKMIKLGISVWEPDPSSAIAAAEAKPTPALDLPQRMQFSPQLLGWFAEAVQCTEQRSVLECKPDPTYSEFCSHSCTTCQRWFELQGLIYRELRLEFWPCLPAIPHRPHSRNYNRWRPDYDGPEWKLWAALKEALAERDRKQRERTA
jgi:hypothetical protein